MSDAQVLELVVHIISTTTSTLQEMGVDIETITEEQVDAFMLGMLATMIELDIIDAESAHTVVTTLTKVGSQIREEMKYMA